VIIKRIWNQWDVFWFSERSLLNLAVFRIILTLSLGGLYFNRMSDLMKYYGEDGFLPKRFALQVLPEFYRPSFLIASWPDSWIYPLHLLLLTGVLLLAFGIGGRILNIVVWILHVAFLQRNFSIAFGADLIGGIFLLLMIGTQSCARLSLVNLIRKRNVQVHSDLFTNMFYRLIQIQLTAIYMWSGFEKLKGASWWDGTALWTVLANPQMVIFDMTWTRHVPLAIAAVTISTVLFEIYFPFLIFSKATRSLALVLGLFFHLGIGVLVSLWSFSALMLCPYVLFFPESTTQSFLRKLGIQVPATVSTD
jgi:hypothetical protein